MNGTDARWSIKCPPETRADILRLARAADMTVATWLGEAVRAASVTPPAPAYAGELELAPGVLVRHRVGGPVMCVLHAEVAERSPYPGMGEGGPTGRWVCQWFQKGTPRTAAFLPIALLAA